MATSTFIWESGSGKAGPGLCCTSEQSEQKAQAAREGGQEDSRRQGTGWGCLQFPVQLAQCSWLSHHALRFAEASLAVTQSLGFRLCVTCCLLAPAGSSPVGPGVLGQGGAWGAYRGGAGRENVITRSSLLKVRHRLAGNRFMGRRGHPGPGLGLRPGGCPTSASGPCPKERRTQRHHRIPAPASGTGRHQDGGGANPVTWVDELGTPRGPHPGPWPTPRPHSGLQTPPWPTPLSHSTPESPHTMSAVPASRPRPSPDEGGQMDA